MQSPGELADEAFRCAAGQALWRFYLTAAVMAETGADVSTVVDGLLDSPDDGHGMDEALLDDMAAGEREQLTRTIGEFYVLQLVEASQRLLAAALRLRVDDDVPPEAVVLACAAQARWRTPQLA